jgi:AIPR protein
MNINVAIIDQRLNAVAEVIREFAREVLKVNDDTRLRSLAFVQLCVQTLLGLSADEAMDCLTDGGDDFGIDAFHIGESIDGEFVVTLFQCKYTHKNLEGAANFEEDGVSKAVNAVRFLFDPHAVITANNRILTRLEEVRSRIVDGDLPRVRVLLCNNGLRWTEIAQKHIDRLGAGDQVSWEHIDHDRLLGIIQASKPVSDSLRLSGKAIVEDFDFSRVMVGKVPISEIAQLLERHGDRLLERNIRRYLGLAGNRVNEGIRSTLLNAAERKNFYFYNNGITLT